MPISPFRPSLLIVTNFCIDNFECQLFLLRASARCVKLLYYYFEQNKMGHKTILTPKSRVDLL